MLKLAVYIQTRASELVHKAVRIFHGALAGSNTRYQWDNLKHVFGVALREDEEEEESQASGPSPSKKPKPTADIWESLMASTLLSTDAAKAKCWVCPTLEKCLSSCGIPLDQLPTRLSAPGTKALCAYRHCSKQGPNYTSICNHIHCEHLAVAVACNYCDSKMYCIILFDKSMLNLAFNCALVYPKFSCD